MVYGKFPPKSLEIDHINQNRLDNRIENLRVVTKSINLQNQKLSSNNTSGHIGVCWIKDANKWRAAIGVDGKLIYLGNYARIEDAIAVRKQAEKHHDFSPLHGRI